MKKKILIIEDETGIRNNIKLLLESENYEVIEASNGVDGVILAQKEVPNLIICDIMMPGIDGYEVLKAITNAKQLPIIPFLFLSAKVEKVDLRKGMNLGADDYICKPYDADDLLDAINVRLAKYETYESKTITNELISSCFKENDKILFKIGTRIEKIIINKILYISADRQYTLIFTVDKKKFIIKRSLSKWEELLPNNLFVRIHRATLINLNYLDKIVKNKNEYILFLNDVDVQFPISRRHLKKIKEFIQ
ncbi:MAG: response regulator [bacterium]